MANFDGAIFDLDGTLLNSMWLWEKIDRDFMQERGLIVSEDFINEIEGLSLNQTAIRIKKLLNLPDTPESLVSQWEQRALYEYSHNIKLKPNVIEYLQRLKNLGIKLATATSLPCKLSVPALKNTGIYDLFDAFCCSDEVGKGKHSPDVFLLAAKKLQLAPQRCVVFEDLLHGILSAKKAGMLAYCVYDEWANRYWQQAKAVSDGYFYDYKDAPLP